MEANLILGIVAACGGALRSFLGYETQSDKKETFDKFKFAQSVARAATVGFITGLALPEGTDLVTALGIVVGTGIGGDVVIKEGYSTVKSALKK